MCNENAYSTEFIDSIYSSGLEEKKKKIVRGRGETTGCNVDDGFDKLFTGGSVVYAIT